MSIVQAITAAMPEEALKEKTVRAHALLDVLYGRLELAPRREALRELISTMLSHRTTHADEEKAYFSMFTHFGSWEGIRDAPYPELVKALSAARFPEAKALHIQQVLTQIISEQGRPSIDFLADLPLTEAMSWLTSLPGVGPKTATLVLLFNFHQPVLPVDTHVLRVTQRLGVIGSGVSAEKAHHLLLSYLPEDAVELFNFHKHFYWHGQKVCVWERPRCEKCPLTAICDWYAANRA